MREPYSARCAALGALGFPMLLPGLDHGVGHPSRRRPREKHLSL